MVISHTADVTEMRVAPAIHHGEPFSRILTTTGRKNLGDEFPPGAPRLAFETWVYIPQAPTISP
jgi:hypothetical protein